MKRFLVLAAACLLLGACTTTNGRIAAKTDFNTPANAKIVLVDPDVQLTLLTATGLQEERADWSRQGHDDLAKAITAALEAKSHQTLLVDPANLQGGRAGQLLRLHQAVGQSIMASSYGVMALPTKKNGFDWTLGEGAKTLAGESGADYALFVTARGSYASGGRYAMMLGAAVLGVSVPLGGQQVFASLVDLKTGRVVWFNVAVAGSGDDMRSPEGGLSISQSLLKSAPL
jgi:hypothetical protein